MNIIIYIIANSIAIWAASRLVPGFVFSGSWQDFLIAGAVLGFVNAFVKPIVKLISLPIILLTLGMFTAVINILLLLLVAHFLPTLSIHGFWAAFWGVVIISLVNHVILASKKRSDQQ